MEEKRKRRVQFFDLKTKETRAGWFHQWGLEAFEPNDSPAFNWTVAVVEDDSGKVFLAHPEHVTFV